MADRATSPLLVVAAALTDADGRVLLQQRPAHKQHGRLWEFPGGKVEAGETPEQGLARELAEELDIEVDPADAQAAAFASRVAEDRHLVLLLYIVRRWHGVPRLLEAAAFDWRHPDAMADLPMPPADHDLTAMLKRLPSQ